MFVWMAVNRRVKTLHRLGAGELGDGLGAFGDGVLGELTGEDKPDSGLDFSRGESSLVAVSAKTSGLTSNTVKGISDQVVQDGHRLFADASLGVDLLEDPHDIGRERLL